MPQRDALLREKVHMARSATKMASHTRYADKMLHYDGHVTMRMWDIASGKTTFEWSHHNVVTLDAGLLLAALMKDPNEPAHGINMLAVGTGATGSILNPDAPGNYQRQLNNEIARKPFSEVTFRDANGAKSAIRTPVVDFTTIFGEGEAVGPLTEMGLVSTISDNTAVLNPNPNIALSPEDYDPTIDTSLYDTLVNYLTFGVVTKPATSNLIITWRLTFGS